MKVKKLPYKNNSNCKKIFFSFFIFALSIFVCDNAKLYSQEKHFDQKIEWTEDVNALEYKIEVKNLSSGKITTYTTSDNFMNLNLSAGNYQYRITVYDFLGRESNISSWQSFEITKASVPTIQSVEKNMNLIVDESNKITVPIEIDSVAEDSTVTFVNTKTNEKVTGKIIVENLESKNGEINTATKVELPKIDDGEWKIVVENPSGLTSESGSVEIKTKDIEQVRAEEEAARLEQERLAEEARRKEEERIAREKAEQEERERLAREEAERKAEEERIAKEEADRKAEEERIAKEEADRKAEEERVAKEESDRKAEEERVAKEEAERKAEEERVAKEESERKAEEERVAKEEADRKAEEERVAKEEADRKAEEERVAKEEADRKAEEERVAKEEADRKAEEERIAKEEAEREAAEKEIADASKDDKKKSKNKKKTRALGINISVGVTDTLNLFNADILSLKQSSGGLDWFNSLPLYMTPGVAASLSVVPNFDWVFKPGIEFMAYSPWGDSIYEKEYDYPDNYWYRSGTGESPCTIRSNIFYEILQLNLIGQLRIVPDHFYLNVKGGGSLFIVRVNSWSWGYWTYTGQKQFNFIYPMVNAGLSLEVTPFKHLVFELGSDYNLALSNKVSLSFVNPYFLLGVRF